jgi:hypothetical protein
MGRTQQSNLRAMNHFKHSPHLLDTILAIRAGVGDGLNDHELTQLLRDGTLLSEAGFSLLSFSEGMVTLTVPEQDLATWYPEHGWIAPEKEKLARALAEKYELSLQEPVNTATNFWDPESGPPVNHYHLELTFCGMTVVVAHPLYAKVRLLGRSAHYRYDWERLSPLALGPDLLRDLAALYACACEGDSTGTPAHPRAVEQILELQGAL